MNQLPKGYYAVQCIADDVPELVADSFTYKGVTYAAEVGVNLFPTIAAALAAATEIPDTVLEGLDYEKFEAPVILLSAGRHGVGRKGPKDRIIFDRSIYVLGEQGLLNEKLVTAPADCMLIPMTEDLGAAVALATALREGGIRTQIYSEQKKFKAKISYADKLRIPYVVFLGEDEIARGECSVKDLRTGEQKSLPVAEAITLIREGIAAMSGDSVIIEK